MQHRPAVADAQPGLPTQLIASHEPVPPTRSRGSARTCPCRTGAQGLVVPMSSVVADLEKRPSPCGRCPSSCRRIRPIANLRCPAGQFFFFCRCRAESTLLPSSAPVQRRRGRRHQEGKGRMGRTGARDTEDLNGNRQRRETGRNDPEGRLWTRDPANAITPEGRGGRRGRHAR